MIQNVDQYLLEGCGRCSLYRTPECKVHNWQKELKLLRKIALDCGLTEELKWSVPCYTFQNHNLAIVSAFKNYCSISFFKGALLNNESGLLEKPGENTQSARLIKFTNAKQIIEHEEAIKAHIYEAIEVEKAGLEVEYKKTSEYNIPEELQSALDNDPEFKAAFEALTPGRQRGYLLHFSQPKQSKTRASRIEKCKDKIFDGKGFNDR
ncbi:YdeI/OmpD-associated family protein [Fulvivirga lutea]|uniref:YdeI/OmpD-associated family protein n=1 Tax=Fulvivirga lutea TaxID=2810512 RepID=A0A974WJ21_9BACT|nr:YdeI/OmpD-associated family protein [Fulvivirga lutea]QSE98042.1 YdeI/OmpD-associated family protein [Fulvivirga lutea]